MEEDDAIKSLLGRGLDVEIQQATWNEAAKLLSALDSIGREGANVVVKIDGGRDDGRVYTLVISGGELGKEFFRQDSAKLNALLREGVVFYARHTQRGRGDG